MDYGLAVIGPIHGHIAMNGVSSASLARLALRHPLPFSHPPAGQVITDYVPPGARLGARAGLLGLSVASLVGLWKLNAHGPGVPATLKQLWR